ncbi:hypothetical protein CAPTEDRAFT_227538 [Capitella teleta]|uniref:Metalloendopeptidase n=1 Tax=Capitella teleta TaxID=283909 RepID=R7TAX7_CAPTE|nr:hypothetical protein CAPTEDRAFT_227538 [Capitella teleta]|eukprot:ELT90667.1 hypothetical protein CAPTEDRAFT_227538 [Capitella teleta]
MTCVTFDEDAKAERKLLFIKDRGCWSYVGFTNQPNQTVSIGDGCQSNGTIAHEVGHALGFWHEQSRPDRDAFIEIHKENVSEGKLYNFEPRTWGEVTTLDVPYDLGSDMHYGAKFYAKDKNSSLTTVHTLDPHMSRVIGQRQELSFYDIKLANKAYCDGVCRSQGVDLEQPCHREGYQDPQACRRCRCPGGFAGDFCERVAPGKKAECGGTVDAERDGTIVSPGYYASEYHSGVQCTWLIKAPEGKRIFLQFLGDFGIAGHLDLCKDFVEVRYNTSLAMTGARFCIDDPPRYPLMSAGNEMLVLFRSYEDSRICDDSRHSWKCKMIFTGFKAKYYAESCGGCSNRKSSNQTVCVRRLSYTCAQPWQETIKIDCPKWWYTESCGMRTVNRVRYATCSRDETYCCGDWVLERGRCIDPVSKKKINILSSISNDIPLADDVSGHYVLPSTQMLSAHHTESPRPTRPPGDLWGPWGEWGECPRTCGGSVLVRTRKCLSSSSCGPSNIQADKQLCAQNPCYRQCIVPKRILCDMWSTCTRAVYEQCNPYCYSGFSLKSNRCFPNSMLGSKVS